MFLLTKENPFDVPSTNVWNATMIRVDVLNQVVQADIGLFASADAFAAKAAPLIVKSIEIPFSTNPELGAAGIAFVEGWAIQNDAFFLGGQPVT